MADIKSVKLELASATRLVFGDKVPRRV